MTPTTSKLKHDINRGRGGDKVDAIDPAAVPLGTDEEAAGTPPSPEAVRLAYKHEIGSSPASSESRDDYGVAAYICVVGTAIIVVASAIVFL